MLDRIGDRWTVLVVGVLRSRDAYDPTGGAATGAT